MTDSIHKGVLSRNSSFELLRIIAMFLIIFYHLLLYFVEPETHNVVYKALQPPFHIGVLLFVLISGYYGIKLSLHGLCKLLLPLLIFYVPVQVVADIINDDIPGALVSTLFISHSPYWFVQTYLWLFLLSPLINLFLKEVTGKGRLYLIVVLGIISVYFGTVNGDPSLEQGKNIINFFFIYSLGNTIAINKEKTLLSR